MAGEDRFHAALSQKFELDAKPFELLEAGLRLPRASVDGRIGGKEIEGIEAKHCELVRNHFDIEPAASRKLMPLGFRDELLPNLEVLGRPLVWALSEDVVGQDVIVSESRDDGNEKVIRRVIVFKVLGLAKHFQEFLHKKLVLRRDLLFAPGKFLVVVVPSRISSPDDKVNIVFQRRVDPSKRLVQEAEGTVAICSLSAVETCRSRTAMASLSLLCRRVDLVVRVWMDVCIVSVIIIITA